MVQLGFLCRFLGPLPKTGLSLMKNVIKPLAGTVLIPLGLTAAASAADAGIHKKILALGHRPSSFIFCSLLRDASHNTTSNDEMEDIIKIVKSLEDSGLLLKGVKETIQNEANEQRKIYWYVTRYIRCKLIKKYFSRKRSYWSWRWCNSKKKKNVSKETRSNRQGKGIVRAGRLRRSLKKMDF